MRKFKFFISIIVIILVLISVYQITLANNTDGVNKIYNFYISTKGITNDKDTKIFITNSTNKNTLIDNKIAPGASRKF